MSTKKERLGFFKLYFKNFKVMLVGNLLFSVPLILSVALIYGLGSLFKQADNLFFLSLVIILIFPFYSGITQITKDVVKGGKAPVRPVKAFKKGIKNNIKYFALYGVLIYICLIASYFSIMLYLKLSEQSWIFYIPSFITVMVSIFLLFMSFSLPILTVTLELKLKHYFKNSALMALGELPMNFYIALTTLALVVISLSGPMLTGNVIIGIIALLMAVFLILPTGISYCAVYRLYPKMEKLFDLEPQEEEQKFPTMPVAIPTDDEGNPIRTYADDREGYVFVDGKMIKKSQANNYEYISESD
ncbi:MAG: hypothetical protein U0L18_02650 [Acutalibacteraceae bacterium]|nr:hypothetical protein [Acutalibacteraceae bacterium]